ncbi:hypothetical protein GOBAR_DD07385 [Gossypium barbadense]|nr:hypothetical protein GOBAR_DD07385 [Gossypium barbadense]
MEFHRLLFTFFIFQALIISQISILCTANSKLFREYIGAEFKDVKFSDVPINPNVDFHFILSFAIDYDTSTSPSPTNGKFNVFWDSTNLSPSHVSSIKSKHPNVKVAISLGGYTVGSQFAYFKPSTVRSWVANAVTSLTSIIKKYNLDGIDIDYEHFQADPQTFAESIGLLIKTLKRNKVISFASIAPYADNEVQRQYLALWNKYGDIIDYVNFQFYAYDKGTTIPQFLSYFNNQMLQLQWCVNVKTDHVSSVWFLYKFPVVNVHCNGCDTHLGEKFFALSSPYFEQMHGRTGYCFGMEQRSIIHPGRTESLGSMFTQNAISTRKTTAAAFPFPF